MLINVGTQWELQKVSFDLTFLGNHNHSSSRFDHILYIFGSLFTMFLEGFFSLFVKHASDIKTRENTMCRGKRTPGEKYNAISFF